MRDDEWLLLDTETTGIAAPIFVVEIAAQRMLGWEPKGPPFRKLLNQNTDIPPEAARVHGYTREILERDGEPALDVYRAFSEYAGNLPLVAYNLDYDFDSVLIPEWERLGIKPIGSPGLCAMRLAQRLLDPVPAGNHKLQTLRQYYRLPERGAHTALGDVETVADLMAGVLRPLAEARGLNLWSDLAAFASSEWYPSRIAFGRFKGRDFHDAVNDDSLRGWLEWLSHSTNARNAQMGGWYLAQLRSTGGAQTGSMGTRPADRAQDPDRRVTVEATEASVVLYANPELEHLKKLIEAARTRLAEVEAEYTKDRRAVDLVQAAIFGLVRDQYQARDRIKLIVEYRKKFLASLISEGEEQAEEVTDEYDKARAQSNRDYEEAAEAATNQRHLSDDDLNELHRLWKKLVRLFHPDRHADQTDKREAYEKLTSAINEARDTGNIELLREIEADPSAFMRQNGWIDLEFGEERDLKSMRKLYTTLQAEIMDIIGLLSALRESPDYELVVLEQRQPGIVKKVTSDQIEAMEAEAALLAEEAKHLKQEIDELISSACPIS